MPILTELTAPAAATPAPVHPPVSPFTSLNVHFGMLLGVDDIDLLQAYPRGKIRLHNGWLHREGVVWGFDVRINPQRELLVAPGLALDAAGRELHLEHDACLGLGAWYQAHEGEPGLVPVVTDNGNRVTFDAHVVVRFAACASRPVPALAEPCGEGDRDTAYSRVEETVALELRPGLAPAAMPPFTCHRLRVLFGLAEARQEDGAVIPADQAVLDARAAILALPADRQPAAYLDALRRFAALDVIDLAPDTDDEDDPSHLFPAAADPAVVLANVHAIELVKQDGRWTLASATPVVDVTVRPALLPTRVIQELLAGPLIAGVAVAPPSGPGVADAAGPRVVVSSVQLTGSTLTFGTTAPLDADSVDAGTVSATALVDNRGWNRVDVHAVQVANSPSAANVTVTFKQRPAGRLLRLVVRGTGDAPILGATGVPLAGAEGGPAGTAHDGHDFVHMLSL